MKFKTISAVAALCATIAMPVAAQDRDGWPNSITIGTGRRGSTGRAGRAGRAGRGPSSRLEHAGAGRAPGAEAAPADRPGGSLDRRGAGGATSENRFDDRKTRVRPPRRVLPIHGG